MADQFKLSFVLCRATGEPLGEPLNAISRKLVRNRNVPGAVTIQLRMDQSPDQEFNYATAIEPGLSRVKVYRTRTIAELAANPSLTKQLVFYGSLPSQGVEEDWGAGIMTCTFQDPRWVMYRRALQSPASFASQDMGSVISSLISTQNTRQQMWFTVVGTTGVIIDRNYDQGKFVGSLIDDLTKVNNGCDIDFSPADGWPSSRSMGTLGVAGRQGTDRPTVMFWYSQEPGGQGGGNIMGGKRQWTDTINSSTQESTDSTGVATLQNYTITTGLDLQDEYDSNSDPTIVASLLAKAVGRVNDQLTPRALYSLGLCTYEAPLPFLDYDLGDTVRLTVKRGSINLDRAQVRVEGYEIQADSEGSILTTPFVSAV